jgi:hypothetical protein
MWAMIEKLRIRSMAMGRMSMATGCG